MIDLLEWSTQCPYCGETIVLLIDPSIDFQEYVEDCFVCCQPMLIRACMSDGQIDSVSLEREND